MDVMDINDITKTLTATSSTTSVNLGAKSNYISVYNAGTALVYVKTGNNAVEAAVGDGFVPPGMMLSFRKEAADTYLAALSTGSDCDLFIQIGKGV